MTDEPLIYQPVVRALEVEAIRLYRAKYPEGPAWQDLDDSTRELWVAHAEKERQNDH
jgi:hypothetical protein